MNKVIPLVKVNWEWIIAEDTTWEKEDEMRLLHPQLLSQVCYKL